MSPGIVDQNRLSTEPDRVFQHASAEYTVAANDDLLFGLEQVHKASLHPRRTWARDGKGQLIARLKGVLQQLLDLFHHGEEERIHMPHGRLRHRLEDAITDAGRTRA